MIESCQTTFLNINKNENVERYGEKERGTVFNKGHKNMHSHGAVTSRGKKNLYK